MSRCKDCVHRISHSRSIGNTLYMWDVCNESGKTLGSMQIFADNECPKFKPVKP